MATSSIFASVKIKDTKTAEAFVAAMEESFNSPFKHSGTAPQTVTTDHDLIKAVWAKRKDV